ncbi:MAG: O-antigen polysaccharide polymerase Wzy, partial [Clostridia bacterium]
AGLLYVLPNGITGNYYAESESVDEVFAPYLTSYGGVGSSFIAEGYFNFGAASLLLFFIYGIILAVLQNAAEKSYRTGAYASFFACCSSFMLISFYIRSDVRTFARYFIWNVAPVILLQQVLIPSLDKRSEKIPTPTISSSNFKGYENGEN